MAQPSGRGALDLAKPCPACGTEGPDRPGYTWWGGVLGPKLLSHAVCRKCKMGYNAKTGKSNTGAIAIYLGVGFVLAVIVFFLISRM